MALAPGHAHRLISRCAQAGLTLLELLVVMALAGIATAAVALSMRDSDERALRRQAEVLISQLESGRSWSRSSGQTLRWSAVDGGHLISGNWQAQPAQRWLDPDIEVQWPRPGADRVLVLGPEPILAAQAITLKLRQQTLSIATDGLSPFELRQP